MKNFNKLLVLILTPIFLANANWLDDIRRSMNEFEAGPIWNNDDARIKCPQTCSRHNRVWNNQQEWRTTRYNEMSVCTCVPK